MIGAILLAQWRSMRTFRISAKPAAVVVSWITGLLFYGFWTGIAFGASVFLANPEYSENYSIVVTSALLLMFLYWQVTPVITASMGASLDLKKLLVYPIPHEKLFTIEVLLRLTTCAEMLIVLTGIAVGIARNPDLGGILAMPRIAGAALLFVVLNLLLSAGVRSLLERILLRKRMREIMMFFFVAIGLLPQILIRRGFRGEAFRDRVPEAVWLPWSAASHLLLNHDRSLSILILLAFTAIAYYFSRRQYERSLRFEGASEAAARPVTASKALAFMENFYRFPGRFLSDPVAAIMEKELRSLTRTPPFRLIFIMGAAFSLVMVVPHLMRKGGGHSNFGGENVMTFITIYAVLMLGQVTYFNCFGFERSAVQFWFSAPVPIVRTLVAKNLTAMLFATIEIGFVSLTALLFRMHPTPQKAAETVLVALLAAVYLISFGNLASVRMPRLLNADKLNQGGASKAMNLLILLCFPVVLLPIGLAYWARWVFESDLVFFLLLALAAVFGGIFYWVGITSAAATANTRREKILTELSRGDGPLSISG